MNTDPVCPICGAPVPSEAPQSLCPRCVLERAATAPDGPSDPTATGEIPSLPRIAAEFPQLEILELIGRGGMGFVFKARQPHLDRFVALKLLPDKLARDPRFAERFHREGRVLARLNHPNIVSVFDFGRTGHFYYLMMEYVDGVDLRQAMRAGRFSPAEALSIVPKICEALQYAHEQGVLHRDVKPANILLDTRGQVKIADFGIAKLVGEDALNVTLTHTGSALGTPHYMAPEQLEQPSTVDHRADIYSLGVVVYEMLTGELPIGRFAPPSDKTPVSAGVDEAVLRALERDPERRQRSVRQLRTEVEDAAAAPPREHPAAEQPESRGPYGTRVLGPARPEPDFMLCNPRLPRMAQAATVYGLVVAPLLWGLNLLTLEPPRSTNAYVAFVDQLVMLVTLPGSLAGVLLWFTGALKLRALKRSGTTLIVSAVLLNIVCFILALAGMFWTEALLPPQDFNRMPAGDALIGLVSVAGAIFEVFTLTWILRNRTRLKALLTGARARENAAPRSRRIWVWLGPALLLLLLLLLLPAGWILTTQPGREQVNPAAEARLMLPEGVVELVALAEHPSKEVWWHPDGTRFDGGSFESQGASFEAGLGQRIVQMLFRTPGIRPGDSSPLFEIEHHAGMRGTSAVREQGRTIPDTELIAAAFDRNLKTTTVRVGVATDPWQTIAESGSNGRAGVSLWRDNKPVKVTFLGAHEKGNNTVILASFNITGTDVRIVAVTGDGTEHPGLLSSQQGEHLEVEFVGLPRATIQDFRFQTRPYRWTSFENVALEPRPPM